MFSLPSTFTRALDDRADGGEELLLNLEVVHRPEAVRSRLRRACKNAGVQAFTPHGLRRMVVTRLIDGGVDVKTAASLTGHSVVVMLRHYQQATDDGRRAAVRTAGLGELRSRGMVIEGPWRAEEG